MLQREYAAPSPSSRSVLSGYPHSAQGPCFPWRGVGGPGSSRSPRKPAGVPGPQQASARSEPLGHLSCLRFPQSKFLGTQHSLTWSKPVYCLALGRRFM